MNFKKSNVLKLAMIGLPLALSGTNGPSVTSADAASTECAVRPGMEAVTGAKKLVVALRTELAGSERLILEHSYLRALEAKLIPRENLKAFAGEQYNVIQSDLRSDALMVSRFGTTQSGAFLREIMNGEAQALSLLLDFARALGLSEDQLREY